jgi:hypothetical protein
MRVLERALLDQFPSGDFNDPTMWLERSGRSGGNATLARKCFIGHFRQFWRGYRGLPLMPPEINQLKNSGLIWPPREQQAANATV